MGLSAVGSALSFSPVSSTANSPNDPSTKIIDVGDLPGGLKETDGESARPSLAGEGQFDIEA